MYRSSPLRSTLNTGYITGLDMCKVCTEAVHCAALWTCVQVQKNVIMTLGGKKWCKIVPVCTCDSSLCARVTLENGCVRTWLQSVCAGDSAGKKWCKIVPVCTCDSRVCARVTPWPHKGVFFLIFVYGKLMNQVVLKGSFYGFLWYVHV